MHTYAFWASRHGALLIMPHPQTFRFKKLSIKLFFWGIVCFCTSKGSFRILKKTWENISKWHYFQNFLKITKLKKNISSSLFHYSERTIAITQINNSLLKIGSDTEKSMGATPACHKKHILLIFTVFFDFLPSKGHLISEWLLDVFIWTKKQTKLFLYFCPTSLK